MTENSKKDFAYVKQIDPNYCGPACVEMLLWYYGLGQKKTMDNGKKVDKTLSDYNTPLQKHLVTLDHVFKSNTLRQEKVGPQEEPWKQWATRPDEIISMIHGFEIENSSSLPSPLSSLWYTFYCNSIDDKGRNDHKENRRRFLAALEGRIEDQNQPPIIIPIHDASHWVIIYGMTDDGRFIGGDPLYFKKTEKISPFIKSSKGCISISNNPQNFSNPINLLMVEKYDDPNINGNPWARMKMQPRNIPVDPRPPGTLMTSAAILDNVRDWLDKYGDPQLKGIGLRSSLFNLVDPLLVRRADRENYTYYLVAVKNYKGEAIQLLRLDAITGEYLDSIQMDPTVLKLELSPKDLSTQSASAAINARQSVSTTQANLASNLMWQPTLESQSAFLPFHQITDGSNTSYLRIDGRRFNNLTSLGPAVTASKNDSSNNT